MFIKKQSNTTRSQADLFVRMQSMAELIVDLHIHSHYSRATSKDCNLEGLYRWGKIKGIAIIGTGDFTHPEWFAELREKLEPAEKGLYKLKDSLAREVDKLVPESVRANPIRFILTVEIATIYKKGDKVRKLHNLIIAPDFQAVSEINARLERIGNLKADGRPILGLDSKELLRISMEANPDNLYVPAHIWTPWFGMFGSKSGFDSIQEAFEELSPQIRAIETGLSSDPYMNWRIDELQSVTILSNSDAHSPQKLGREASVINCDMNYDAIIGAIKTNDTRFVGTIEFYPAEGKYHYDGHRDCKVSFSPAQTREHNGICPVCHRPLTVGVDYRVSELANKPEDYKPTTAKQVEYIIPLVEIVAELKGVGSGSKAVVAEYQRIIASLGHEFEILRNVDVEVIKREGFEDLAYAITRMRRHDIHIEPGYDGVYGVITLFANNTERKKLGDQMTLI
ncbi:MAG: hypothetical protein RI947_731 [Candidatus Parcubacteria bacterium]